MKPALAGDSVIMDLMVRSVSAADLAFLAAMAVAACHDPRAPIPADAQESPEVRRLVEEWGRSGDVGVIASTPEGERQGAVWCRLFPQPLARASDGSVLAEVAIAVEERWRGKGVGSAVLGELVRSACTDGHTALTLKVSHRNPLARRLYERGGFKSFRTTERAVWMRLDLC